MGIASKLTSVIYRERSCERKGKGLFRRITGRAYRFLKDGIERNDALFLIMAELQLTKSFCSPVLKYPEKGILQ
jgi:hypothetical protein